MIYRINNHGELTINKDEALITMPFHLINADGLLVLEEGYRKKIKELNYSDCFFYAESITSIRDRVQMSFDMTEAFDFHNIRKIKFDDLFPYFESMIDIAKQDVDVLWGKNNFALDTKEEKVKAFLFDFEGFKLYRKDAPIDGLKELILLALTTKDSILGKPRRVDFIQQNERVIQFAEEVLKCTSIEEIELVCEGYRKEIEYQRAQKELEEEERRKASKLSRLKAKVLPDKGKKEVASTDEQLKKSLKNKEEKLNTQPKMKSKQSFLDKITSPKGLIGVVALLMFIGVVSTLLGNQSTQADQEKKKKEEMNQQNKILDVYRIYANANTDKQRKKAYAKMDALDYNKMTDKDKKIAINWYIKQDKLAKAVRLDNESAYQVGDKLVEDEKGLEKLKKVASQIERNPVVEFDIASIEKEYQTMIENNNIHFNERRASEIVEAYLMTNQKNELETFIKKVQQKDKLSYENLQNEHGEKISAFDDKVEIEEEIKDLESSIKKNKKAKKKAKKKKRKRIAKKIKGLESDLAAKKSEKERKEEIIKK